MLNFKFERQDNTNAIKEKIELRNTKMQQKPTKQQNWNMKRLFFTALCAGMAILSPAQNGKKVYADYHGVRYTRQHDGKLGRWEMYANTEKSSTGRKSLCYNADLILPNGQHEIAATAYPQVGMQSNLDPDYIEYQILSAKTAKIDGFFIEWGFLPHENDDLLRAMQPIAAKYGFEIGVNWCDGWLYYDWISKIYPEINTREAKSKYYVKCFQYLVDSVFTGPTTPMVKGHPVFYLFGPGAKPEEYAEIHRQIQLPDGMKQPIALRRWADWGKLDNNRYIPVTESAEMNRWKKLGAIPTAWLPARVRTKDEAHPHWDNYALPEDLTAFMTPFRDSIWNSNDSRFVIKSGFAMPGMDNSGCAGWGRGHFFYIPRDNGETYKKMWEFSLASKDSLDMMFIASWSDYTEGHEIEPTVENGDRELRNTLTYAAQFKEEKADPRGLDLPLVLFQLRKKARFLEACKLDVSACQSALDRAALLISQGRYPVAKGLLAQMNRDIENAHAALKQQMVRLRETDGQLVLKGKGNAKAYDASETLNVILPKKLASELQLHNYIGYIYFEYLDEGKETLFIRSSTNKEPKNMFNIVGRIRTDNSGEWKKAKIELYKENIQYKYNLPAFYLKGNVKVRNLSVGYTIYSL